MARVVAANPTTVYDASEGDKFSADTSLTVVSCYTCGIRYAIPTSLYRSAHRYHAGTANGWWLCCPLGHTWGYTGESEEEKLRRQLRVERDRSGRLASDLDQTKASLRAQKGATTRIRRRVANGVCPCCNRSFKDLARHMESKHPDFRKAASK